jgi:hypothetical protein
MSEQFIDISLEDAPDGPTVLPDKMTKFRITSASKKQKEGSAYPYCAIQAQPFDTGDPNLDKKKVFLNLSYHPEMIWMLKDLHKAAGIPLKGFDDNSYIGKEFGAIPKIKGTGADKQNEIKPPFHSI